MAASSPPPSSGAATPNANSDASRQFELLLLPYIVDLPLRDQCEMMKCSFFSLVKSERMKPIDYRSPDRKWWVHFSGNPITAWRRSGMPIS